MFTRYFRKKDDASRREAGIKAKVNRDITISAIIKERDDMNFLSFGVAICSKKDQFEKAKGRLKSTAIAGSNHPFATIRVEKSTTRKELVKLFVENANSIYSDLVPAKPSVSYEVVS
jgi:hypothetical protein